MQSQAWRPLGVVWRPPAPAIVFLAAAVSALLLHSYGLRIAAGAFTHRRCPRLHPYPQKEDDHPAAARTGN